MSLNGTHPIEGIPISPDVKFETKTIPYAPGMPVRKEIGKLYPPKDDFTKKQWTLFVYGLEAFKKMPVDETLSYFQVAGIHGYPETKWDDAPPPPQDPKEKPPPGQNPFGGYCHHNMISFPTWHRPYMLLFEQQIWKHMKAQIKEWADRKVINESEVVEWTKAADQWRLPYWDWARRQSYNDEFALPRSFTEKKVPIYPPTGEVKRSNPLWGFVNPEKDADDDPLPFGQMPPNKEKWNIKDDPGDPVLPWSQCSGVSRYGVTKVEVTNKKKGTTKTVYGGLDGVNNYELVNAYMDDFVDQWYPMVLSDTSTGSTVSNKPPGNLSDALSRMFSPEYNSTWGTFSTTKWFKEGAANHSTGYMSLEYIHNNVHNVSGGGDFSLGGVGHMSDVPVAAFDPLFWMHHCMIDRLLSMWQVIHWDLWWDTTEPVDSKFPDKGPNDPLQPFHTNDKGDVWTSTGARDWTKLHYSYDDLTPEKRAIGPCGKLNEEQYIKDIKQLIQDIYPSTANFVQSVYRDDKVENPEFFGSENSKRGLWDDYLINVIYDRYALNGRSYSIEFWLGDENNPGNKIGHVYSLGGMTPSSDTKPGCESCGAQKDSGVLSRAQVPITIPLMKQALNADNEKIYSTRSDEVEAYLKKNLHWKFVEIGGAVKNADLFPETKISVLFGTGKAASHGGIFDTERVPVPKYGDYKISYQVTADKKYGVAPDDELLGEGKTNYRKLD